MIGSGGKKEGWPECFQDLGGWFPLPQDELHTPKVNLQDEFNFSIDDGHANWELSFPEDLQNDLWGNDTQYGISSSQPLLGELNSTILQERTPLGVISEKTPNLLASGGKLFTIKTEENRSPLKTKGNVLLSQGIVKSASDDSTLFNMAATFEQKTTTTTNNNNNINNNNNNFNSNPVIITNNCYLLPITVPDIASAKLNSSSLSTSFITTSQKKEHPQQHQITPTSVQEMNNQQQQHTKKVSAVGRENVNSSNITTLYGDNVAATLVQQAKLENVRIKDEEQCLEDGFKVPAISCNNDIISLGETATTTTTTSTPPPPRAGLRRDKPQLKLNIAAAVNVPKFTASSLNTPEVLGPLVDNNSKEFNLLQYVCNDGEFPGLSSQEVEDDDSNLEERTVVRDHDYTDSWQSSDIKSDIVIKSEPGSPLSTTSCSISNRSSNRKDQQQQRARKKRQRGDSSDYNISSATEDDDTTDYSENDSQQEWVPTPAKKRKKRKTLSTNSIKANGKSGIKKATAGGSASVRTSTHNSGTPVVQDKYRALRERNNEASRRSRMNRKQRDVEMLVMAEELHKKNVYLKARAEKMESLVKYMRAEIMKALTKPK